MVHIGLFARMCRSKSEKEREEFSLTDVSYQKELNSLLEMSHDQ